MKLSEILRQFIAVTGGTSWNPKKWGPAIKRILKGKARVWLMKKAKDRERDEPEK